MEKELREQGIRVWFEEIGFSVGGILQGAGWALMVAGAVQAFGPILGLDSKQTNAVSTALAGGVWKINLFD